MKDIHDVGPSPMIFSSTGPSSKLDKFYSTTYSTTHKHWLPKQMSLQTLKYAPVMASHKMKVPILITKRKTGYTSNLNSFVTYDPVVDEKDFKQVFFYKNILFH
jgi:hypothetical protein